MLCRILVCLFAVWAWSAPVWAGTMVEARCEACGYASGNLFIFGGRANFQTVCLFPAFCKGRRSLVTVNLLGNDRSSRDCPGETPVPYTDARLQGEPGGETVASWNLPELPGHTVRLTDGAHLCPRCGVFKLRFHPAGFWD